MEDPGLGVELELQLLAYATAMAKPDPSHISALCLSLQQHWVLNPLSHNGNSDPCVSCYLWTNSKLLGLAFEASAVPDHRSPGLLLFKSLLPPSSEPSSRLMCPLHQ